MKFVKYFSFTVMLCHCDLKGLTSFCLSISLYQLTILVTVLQTSPRSVHQCYLMCVVCFRPGRVSHGDLSERRHVHQPDWRIRV